MLSEVSRVKVQVSKEGAIFEFEGKSLGPYSLDGGSLYTSKELSHTCSPTGYTLNPGLQ